LAADLSQPALSHRSSLRWRRLCCIFAVFLALAAPAAPAQEKVLWLKTDWPPVFMPSGRGFGDAVLTWLQQRLPGYNHEIRRLPLARLLKAMEDPQAIICTSNLLRTPAREAQFLISRDVMRMPALGLVVRGSDTDAFQPLRDARGMVEFRSLLHQPALDGAINENRAYGAVLDNLLRDPTVTAPLIRLPKTGNMVSMLAAKRVDWILLYPFEAIWQARQEQTVPALSTLAIAEIPAFNRGGVTCNRVPGAETLVAAIDRLIEGRPDEPWLAPMLEWLDPETRQRVGARH
jgi:uncharacterized protein (TIGR02285 family)